MFKRAALDVLLAQLDSFCFVFFTFCLFVCLFSQTFLLIAFSASLGAGRMMK